MTIEMYTIWLCKNYQKTKSLKQQKTSTFLHINWTVWFRSMLKDPISRILLLSPGPNSFLPSLFLNWAHFLVVIACRCSYIFVLPFFSWVLFSMYFHSFEWEALFSIATLLYPVSATEQLPIFSFLTCWINSLPVMINSLDCIRHT